MNMEFKYKLTGESVMRYSHKKHTRADKAALIISLLALAALIIK